MCISVVDLELKQDVILYSGVVLYKACCIDMVSSRRIGGADWLGRVIAPSCAYGG